MSIRRGEVWSYTPVLSRTGQSLVRVVVSAEAYNATSVPIVHALHVVDSDPENLLGIRLVGHGWALVGSLEGTMKNRLGERLGVISTEEQDAIDSAVKALLDLD